MWKEENSHLHRGFEFRDFIEVFTFMTNVALLAQKMVHPPNWSNVYNMVDIKLFTHKAKDSNTEKDIKLSKGIDKFFNNE